jgi:hypothetical protein
VTRTISFGDQSLTVVITETGDRNRTGCWADMTLGNLSRRLYLSPGKDPLNQADLNRVDEELIIQWWGRAG